MRWRMAGLLIAVLVSVVVPYLATRSATRSAVVANEWVSHSAQIRIAVYKLLYRLRDTEAATYSLLQGVGTRELRERINGSESRIEPLLATLRGLTTDNATEQSRLHTLQSVVEQRVKLMRLARQRYAAGNPAGAYQALGTAANKYPYSDLAEHVVNTERQLRDRRVAVAQQKSHTAFLVRAGAAVAQLLLLSAVVVVSERAIGRRLHAERISRQAVERAQRIVQTVREPMAVLDARLNLLMVNAAFEELYGATGVNDADGAAEEHPLCDAGRGAWSDEVVRQRLTDVVTRNRELWDYELEQTTVDGVDRHMLVNAWRMLLPDREEPALLLSVIDVTARTLAENRVTELNARLEDQVDRISEVNRELEAFSYSVSHDLRAPLRHIAGFSERLGRHLGAGADAKTAHYLEVIDGAVKQMAQLIDGLLAYSRLGRGALRMQPVDMQALAEEVRDAIASDTRGRSIAWRIGTLPVVEGDERMLRTVWQNLLDNAVKYTRGREHAQIAIDAEHTQHNEYVFTVRDNGAGFDMEYADKLFGVFQRLHKASEFPGSGIGLASVRRIIMRHGGRIWAESEPDQGARFHFSLPAPDTSEA